MIPDDKEKETHAILALCDSPKEEVRTMGMEMIDKRKKALNYENSELLSCLSEHPDVYVQTKVAEALGKEEVTPDFAQKFDRQVLRQRNMARQAKEIIKDRLNQHIDLDEEMLLELAKSTNTKDAEWAIFQLTKLALAGKIDDTKFKII